MKYPKLFDGPSPGGESSIRALNRNDYSAPFLTIYGHNFVASKADDYNSVTVKRGEPYFWTAYWTASKLQELTLNPELSIKNYPDKTGTTIPYGRQPEIQDSPYYAYVGDNYLLTYFRDAADYTAPTTNYWPVLDYIGRPTPKYTPGLPGGENKSVDFSTTILAAGLSSLFTTMSTFPCGWMDTDFRFKFGISWLYPEDPAHPTTSKQPRMFIGDTITRTIHEVYPPRYTGRDMDLYTPACVGRGKLQYLGLVKETISGAPKVWKTKVDPFLAYSSDWGETWSQTPATTLVPYFSKWGMNYKAPPYDRDWYDNTQLDYAGLYGMMMYAGSGKVWYVMPNAMTSPSPTDDPRSAVYAPGLFLADAGTDNFVRVAWPADTWVTNHGGYPEIVSGDTWEIGFRRLNKLHCAHFVFGDGCLYMPVIPYLTTTDPVGSEITGWRIMFTHDFGATWTTSDIIPDAVQYVGSGCFAGTVINPYVPGKKPGRLFFLGFDVATSQFEVWVTNGSFDAWKRIFIQTDAFPFVGMDQGGDPFYDTAFYGVDYLSIFPAFPGEFDHG